MYMTALVAIRWHYHWKAVFDNMRSEGKAAKAAIIAVARRLLVRINAMIKTGSSYQTERQLLKSPSIESFLNSCCEG